MAQQHKVHPLFVWLQHTRHQYQLTQFPAESRRQNDGARCWHTLLLIKTTGLIFLEHVAVNIEDARRLPLRAVNNADGTLSLF
jgi:hypothetical protein